MKRLACSRSPSQVADEPTTPTRGAAWSWRFMVLLAAIVFCSVVPMTCELDMRGPKQWMEGITLESSQETWLRQRGGEANAWLNPTRNGRPRIVKPPLAVWSNMLAWSAVDESDYEVTTLIHRARLASVVMTVVLILAVCWIGCSIEDPMLGILAAAVTGAMSLVQMQARIASYDIYLAAWATLSVAAAMWSFRPFAARAPAMSGTVLGCLAAGIFLGLACLSKGPLAVTLLVVPMIAVIVLQPNRRGRSVLGLLAILLVGVIVAAPWYLYIAAQNPRVWNSWLIEFQATGPNTQEVSTFYLTNLFRLTLPWTLFIIGGVCLPFLCRGEVRRRRFLPWLWFLSLLLIYSSTGSKAIRYMIPLAPPLALLIAGVWRDHEALVRLGRPDPTAWRVTVPHWIGLIAASFLVGPFFAAQDELAAWGVIKSAIIDPVGWPFALGMTVPLIIVAIIGARLQHLQRPMPAALATCAWTILATTVYWHGFVRSYDSGATVRPTSDKISAIVGSSPLGCLYVSSGDHAHHQFLLYMKRVIPNVKPKDLDHFVMHGCNTPAAPPIDANTGFVYCMADADDHHDQIMRAAGFQLVCDFYDKPGQARRLWRCRKAPVVHDLAAWSSVRQGHILRSASKHKLV